MGVPLAWATSGKDVRKAHLPRRGGGAGVLSFVHDGSASAGGVGKKTATRLLSCVQVRLKVPVGCVRLPKLRCMPLELQLSTAKEPTGSVDAVAFRVGWIVTV